MELDGYTFMNFVGEYRSYIASVAVTVFATLFALKSKKPKAFEKVQSDLLPISYLLLGFFAFVLVLGVRINVGLAGSDLESLIQGGKVTDNSALKRLNSAYEGNRTTARTIDFMWFLLFTLVCIEYVLKFINWFLSDDESS